MLLVPGLFGKHFAERFRRDFDALCRILFMLGRFMSLLFGVIEGLRLFRVLLGGPARVAGGKIKLPQTGVLFKGVPQGNVGGLLLLEGVQRGLEQPAAFLCEDQVLPVPIAHLLRGGAAKA